MPRLPSFTPQELGRILELRGFELDRVKGSHHIYYHSESGQRVVVPFHKRDLPRGTLRAILRQAGIDPQELGD
ncbi:MAG: type II toxin-antitoxin system HicA family toxin [Caldilineaceae bacterium]|nr:type II toxin-antitoxin system HicA family toxin [Caldilineaceae bacterium]MBP8110704.1 type II toxin-antitoxin system HicA family toxin [Caldilineaceae bacterium]MBP8122415.1 type II toxin-antitoxin system HicA family toxin [Caldilineaceae bacterium]MBP9074500.1 type II toxin-antitoxin system HicA family toxin [Caldilineaceae bacterium]